MRNPYNHKKNQKNVKIFFRIFEYKKSEKVKIWENLNIKNQKKSEFEFTDKNDKEIIMALKHLFDYFSVFIEKD